MINIIEEIINFLEYLTKNEHDIEKREEGNLIKKFGKENYKRIYSLLVSRGRIGSLPFEKNEKNFRKIYITDEGLEFLENYYQRTTLNEHNKSTLYLTTILVLTTILSAFLGIKLTDPLILIIIYLILVILTTVIFKKNKIIRV